MDQASASEWQMLEDSALRWVRDAAGPLSPDERWQQMAGFGWLGISLPEACDGLGQGLAELCALARALGTGPINDPIGPVLVQAGGLMARCASPEQQQRWLAPIARGSARLVPAVLERGQSWRDDRFATQAKADTPTQGWVLEGEKALVAGADRADAFLVAAQAQRFTAARFPAWTLRVRREWTGTVSLGDIDRVAADVAGGRGRVWHGQNGVGKSWTAAAVALSLVESVSVRWLHWPTMVARMKDEVAGGGQLGPLVVKLVGIPRILIVDELAGRRTEFEAELAERIIGPRAESGAVVITTNMTADDCRAYVGDRVWSRLGASCRIGEVGGVDRRRSP